MKFKVDASCRRPQTSKGDGRWHPLDELPVATVEFPKIVIELAHARQWPAQRCYAKPLLCNAAGCLLSAMHTVVRRPLGGLFLRPNGVQNGGKMGPQWLSGGLLELLGLLKASWSGLGGFLGWSGRPLRRSWSCLGSLLGALGRVLCALEAVVEAS